MHHSEQFFLKIPPHILLHQLLWSPYKDIEKMEEKNIFFDYINQTPIANILVPWVMTPFF